MNAKKVHQDDGSEKVALDKSKLKAEIKLLQTEDNLKSFELTQKRLEPKWSKKVANLSSLGTFLIALAAAGTLALNMIINDQATNREDEERQQQLITGLSDDRTVVKIASLEGLKSRLKSGDESTMTALVYAATSESKSHLRDFFFDAIKTNSKKAKTILLSVSQSANAEATDSMASWGLAKREYDRLPEEQKKTLGQQIRNDIRQYLAEADLNQRIFVNSQIFVSKLDGTERPKFDRGNLRWYSFLGENINFNKASFVGANLYRTDFYGVKLTNANFQNSRIVLSDFQYADLQNADFSNAKFETRAVSQIDRDGAKKRDFTLFKNADLSNAKFDGACLGNADFSQVGKINLQIFAKAKFGKVSFSPTQWNSLESLGIPTAANKEC